MKDLHYIPFAALKQMGGNAKHLAEAEQKAAYWLYLGNLASERGEHEKAERHYAKSQKWHDLMNHLLGNGDGSERDNAK